MNRLYSELQWLPRAPEAFARALKALANSAGPLGRELQALALHGLDLNQLTKLAKVIAKARSDGKSLDPLVPFRLAVLSNSTIDLTVPALVASAARHGIALEVVQPSYDQVAQEALTPGSVVNASVPDAVLFALDYRALPLKLSLGNAEAASATVQGAIGYLQALRDGIKSNSKAVCIFQSFAPPVEPKAVYKVLATYDVLCCPSVCVEGGPTVALEANAMGTPVIGTRIGGLVEIVTDNTNGRLVAPGDWRALADVLKQIALDPCSTIDRWRPLVHPPRTMDEIVQDYLGLYSAFHPSQLPL